MPHPLGAACMHPFISSQALMLPQAAALRRLAKQARSRRRAARIRGGEGSSLGDIAGPNPLTTRRRDGSPC
eukprot:scaffold8119_cov444-Prasinococcus_capsulatus_cf.AAC.3